MVIQTRSIVLLFATLNAVPVSANSVFQDASGRDRSGKTAIKKAETQPEKPAPKVTTAKSAAPAKVAAAPKPVKSEKKTKAAIAKPAATAKKTEAAVVKNEPVTTAAKFSRLTLMTAPLARIEMAGRALALANAEGLFVFEEVPLGNVTLQVEADGYEPWSGVVAVKGATTDFTVPLKKRVTTGALAITVNQPDAEIFINDKLGLKSVSGQQINVEGLLPGTHQIRVVKPGYKEWRSVVQVSVGESRKIEVSLSLGVNLEMVRVPAGEFLMGNDRGPKDSSPAHPVVLPEFEISRREITNRFYKTFLEATGRAAPDPQHSGWQNGTYLADKADAPVAGITWDDAAAFCKWLSQEGGAVYRLPTEAEWERAARTVGNVYQSISIVWEWCQDWYDPEYYKRKDKLSPQGPVLMPNPRQDKGPQGRVIRGGSASSAGRAVRVFERNAAQPQQGRADIGFRVVREVR